LPEVFKIVIFEGIFFLTLKKIKNGLTFFSWHGSINFQLMKVIFN